MAQSLRALSTNWSERLEAEALAKHRHDRHRVREDFVGHDADGRLRTGRSISYAPAGEQLTNLHLTQGRALAEEYLQAEVVPTRCAYLFYGPDAFVAPHQDVVQCEVTLLVPFTPGRLCLHPDGLADSPAEMLRRFHAGDLPVQEVVHYEPGTAYAITGGSVIHSRRSEPGYEATMALCYATPAALRSPGKSGRGDGPR